MIQYNYNISIIIPVFNGEKYINRCIDTIINQNYDSMEILIVNDGSTDNTLEKCNEYAQKFENIRIIKQKNKGVCYSRNVGIKNAQGRYIFFVDADDYLLENSFNGIDELLQDDVDIIKFSYIITNKGSKQKIIFHEKKYNFNVDCKETFFKEFLENSYENMVWGQLIKNSLLSNINFEETLFYAEDFLFNYELYSKARTIMYTEKIIYNYERNENSVTMNMENKKILRKIDNLVYVFDKLISEDENLTQKKCLEVKFLKETIPQIMMLFFDKKISKKQVIQQYKNILRKTIFVDIFFNIENIDLKNYRYKIIYKCMKKKNYNLLYFFSKIYMILKKIKIVIVNYKSK